jgi:hypothetical protein
LVSRVLIHEDIGVSQHVFSKAKYRFHKSMAGDGLGGEGAARVMAVKRLNLLEIVRGCELKEGRLLLVLYPQFETCGV